MRLTVITPTLAALVLSIPLEARAQRADSAAIAVRAHADTQAIKPERPFVTCAQSMGRAALAGAVLGGIEAVTVPRSRAFGEPASTTGRLVLTGAAEGAGFFTLLSALFAPCGPVRFPGW